MKRDEWDAALSKLAERRTEQLKKLKRTGKTLDQLVIETGWSKRMLAQWLVQNPTGPRKQG